MSLSRERVVAAKARADAALHFDGHPDDWDDVAHSAVVDVPVMADALLRVLDIHRREMFGGDAMCSSCLRYTSPMPGRVPWPCATVRAVTGDGSSSDTERSEQ